MGVLLKRALDQAAVWHRFQRRKYPGIDVPYMSHLAGVTAILARHCFDEEVLAAGALHDAVEDTEATLAIIERSFGPRVAMLVGHVSEPDKSLPWEERKRRYIEHFAVGPWDAQAISLADKIDNLQSIIVCASEYGDPWAQLNRGREVQIARFEALRKVAMNVCGDRPLVHEYAETLDVARRC